jgi:hypothetical protein
MTPAELTALLAPVRAKLNEIDRAAELGLTRSPDPRHVAVSYAVKSIRAELDKLDPHVADIGLVALGIAALGLLKELRTARTGVDIEDMVYAPERSADWRARADALLAAAYAKG